MSKFSMKATAAAVVIGGAIASAVSASAALNLPTMSCSYMFNTNMKLGSRGSSVMDLQKVLNMYPQTMIAASGAGSPGMETTYFGNATKAAVNKFQALHLVELGITAPTGNVFAGTRGLLNQVCTGTTMPGTGTGTGSTSMGPVSATLSPNQPTSMIVQGQAAARLADITFTGNGTVTNLQLQRTGVSADTTLVNVYLYDGNTRISDAASVVTGGYINFNSTTGLFTVSGSRTLTVRADILGTAAGQSVGVKLNSMTAGGTASTFSNVNGNALQIANVIPATVQFASPITQSGSCSLVSGATTCVDAGTTNYNVWEGVATVSTRDVNLKAATFKFVGSAPVDSMANLSLYVDGAKVSGPSTVNALNNNKVTFDLGSTPYLLKTGSHTIDVRADIVKGSNRTISMSVENVADLMLEDTNLIGVNIAATVGASTPLTQGNSVYKVIGVNKGTVTVNTDPSFSTNKVTGGATNVPVGQYVLKAYGEDVKVNTMQLAFTLGTITTLNNVSLYVNGGQVGTSLNYTGSALTYTLGSSLIIPANTSVTLTVKADIVSTSSAAYTTGTVTALLGGVSSNAQGQSSNELTSVAPSAVSGNTLTISSGAGTFARTSGFTAFTTSPNSSSVKIGSFTLQANSAEAVKVNSITLTATATAPALSNPLTNLSNLVVKDGSTILGTPVGNPSTSNTYSFSDITIPANGTKTFDVYADLGSATGTAQVDMSVSYRGAVSNTTTTSSATGVAITQSVSTLAAPALVSSSPVSQFVVGGTTYGVATFKLSTGGAGTSANIREMRFFVSGTDAATAVTVGGVTAPVVAGTSTVTGLNINIGSTGTDVPVTITYAGFQNSTTGGSLQAGVTSTTTLTYVEGTSGSGTVITNGTAVASNPMYLVASKPTVTVSSTQGGTLILGAENKVGEFTVTADANGKIAVASTTVNVSAVGFTSPVFTSFRIADGNTTITSGSVATTSATTAVVSFSPNAYEISAGQSKTFSLYAVVSGSASAGITPYVASSLTASGFKWNDVLGGGTTYTGSSILNFPTNSWSTAR